MGGSINSQAVPDAIASAKKTFESLATTPVSPAEMDRARNEVMSELQSILSKPDTLSEGWLDQDTYRLSETKSPTLVVGGLTPADIQRLAARLLNSSMATVVLGDSQQLKAALRGRVQFEVLGEVTDSSKPASTPAKPGNSGIPY
jgi:predicted Zn-dependent peptidase